MKTRDLFLMAGAAGVAAGSLWAALPASIAAVPQVRQVAAAAVYYSGCNEVRALGKAPLYRGDPGYRSGMDGDSDGIACEPYRTD